MNKSRFKLNLQHFAAEPELTKSTNIQVSPREINFVSSFSRDWQAFLDVMGVTRLVEKQPGQVLKSKRAKVNLKNGKIGEGEVIPYSESFVETVDYEELQLEKFKKAVSIEAIAEHGYEDAIRLTDEEFASELKADVMGRYYAYIKTGTLKATESDLQMALSMARSMVLNKWKKMHRTVTEIVGFCNIDDVGKWLGKSNIGAQVTNQYGMTYMKGWLGFGTLFLCSDDEIPKGMVVATPVNNIISYYINPGHQDFGRAGLSFVVDRDIPIVGFKTVGNYMTDVSENNALMGLRLFSEYQDGIAVITFGEDEATDSADLTAITIGDLQLSPAFDAGTTTYTATATGESDKVTAKTLYTDAEVAITNGSTRVKNGGTATWSSGTNTVTFAVTNDTTTKTYTVTVTKS